MHKYKLMLVAFFLFCFINTNAKCADHVLQDRVTNYYNLEKENNWEKTYQYRTPLYRKSINIKLYKRKMEENNKGWKLIEFRIIESITKDNYAALKMEFVEKVPKGYFPFNAYNGIKIMQVSTWEQIDNIWYCRNAGTRTHLPLNGDLVMKDNQKPISIFSECNSEKPKKHSVPIKVHLKQIE